MTDEELTSIWNDLVKSYGDTLPDPVHCPREFSHYVKLYNYERYLNEFRKANERRD
jgi:hypothetical protein